MLHILLAAAVPFQRIFDESSPTHGFINRQALSILRSDGLINEANVFENYLPDFDRGCDWADTGWMNIGHMYDPITETGFRGWPSAVQLVQFYWDRAGALFSDQAYHQAFFFLGAAAHLVQDLCVPHHAAAKVFAGHRQFEHTARHHRHRYAVYESGIYDLADQATGWVINNAVYTRQYYSHCINSDLDPVAREAAIADLLPRAMRTSAGFVAFFIAQGGGSGWAYAHFCFLPDLGPDISRQPEPLPMLWRI